VVQTCALPISTPKRTDSPSRSTASSSDLYVYYGTVQRSLELAVEREGLSVRFGVGRIDIPWEDMAGVAYVEQPARMGRVAGAGLPGLQMGWYRLEGYGRVYRLTTAARPVVYVDTRPDAG